MQDHNLPDSIDLEPEDQEKQPKQKRIDRLTRLDKRLAAQMYSLGVSQRKIAIALNRDVRTIYKQIKSLDLIRGGAPDAIRERVSSFMDLLDPVAAVTHANCMVSGDIDIKSKHSLAHLKGKQYLTEETRNIVTTVSDDQINKSLSDAMLAALKLSATDTAYQVSTDKDSCTEIVHDNDSVQDVAQIQQGANSVLTAVKRPRRRRMKRRKPRKQAANSSQANSEPNEPRGDSTPDAGEV
jgi:hypothetical protein